MRRLERLLAALFVFAFLVPSVASAETEAQLKAQLDSLKSETRRAGEAYSKAYWQLDETEVRLKKTNARIKTTNKRLRVAKKRLNSRAEAMYRREELDLVGFLVGASSFEEFVSRLDYLSRVGEADARAVLDVKNLSARLKAQRSDLAAEQRKRSKSVDRLRSQRDKLQSRLQSKEAEFKRVKARLDQLRSGGSVPRGVAAVAGPNGMVFPVVGSYYYSDTWGASRSGGRRRHQGTDIMARRGTPVVAILSGTVTARTGGLGGKTIWLRADNGWQFYYAHLDTWAVRSGRVRAGQVIATVGSTGNASASAPHLHLQIHPGGGGPVNPYPYLRAME